MGRILPAMGIFRYFFGGLIARHKRFWSFTDQEIRFIAAKISALLGFLDCSAKPANGRLIALRMEFCDCEGIIDYRCHGMAELPLGAKVQHFHQTEWLPRITLDDILHKPASVRKELETKRKPRLSA
jgi:hypothetical protein